MAPQLVDLLEHESTWKAEEGFDLWSALDETAISLEESFQNYISGDLEYSTHRQGAKAMSRAWKHIDQVLLDIIEYRD